MAPTNPQQQLQRTPATAPENPSSDPGSGFSRDPVVTTAGQERQILVAVRVAVRVAVQAAVLVAVQVAVLAAELVEGRGIDSSASRQYPVSCFRGY